ncbi:MAG: low affinity iron permease family protein [Methyloceanibacter sp.]|uniref:low affinity iron permease family protein n=1 Tax=Methyloceanibacter sp. TaxID=1965321 RepID=UPI003D9B22AC
MTASRLWFVHFAQAVSHITGHPLTFIVAVSIILLWGISGPIFGFSDTWQLVINTGTTIITFLMVFVIQNTQNRDTASLHIKIDELIRVTVNARNALLDLEQLDDKELEQLRLDYAKLAQEELPHHRKGPARTKAIPGKPSTRKR